MFSCPSNMGQVVKCEAIYYPGEVPRTGNIRSLACRKERSGSASNTLTVSGLKPCLLDVTSVDLLDTRICCTNELLADASDTARSHRHHHKGLSCCRWKLPMPIQSIQLPLTSKWALSQRYTQQSFVSDLTSEQTATFW